MHAPTRSHPNPKIKACTQQACIKCCTDNQCEGHREQREKDREKELIMEGKHPLQILANQQRASAVKPGAYHEPAFRYLGETILIWDLGQYMANPKLRDDAIRKSRRYIESQMYIRTQSRNLKRKQFAMDTPENENRTKRFKRVMEHLYQTSLK